MDINELIKTVSGLVDKEYTWDESGDQDYGSMPDNQKDSFGRFSLTGRCEPEDAIWRRDLQDSFYTGLKVGICPHSGLNLRARHYTYR